MMPPRAAPATRPGLAEPERSSTHRAFTLMEVLLALGLICVLMGSVLGFLFQIGSQRDVLAAAGARQQGATALFERMEADLMCVVASGVSGEAGVQGDSSRLTLLTRGTMLPGEPGKEIGRAHV